LLFIGPYVTGGIDIFKMAFTSLQVVVVAGDAARLQLASHSSAVIMGVCRRAGPKIAALSAESAVLRTSSGFGVHNAAGEYLRAFELLADPVRTGKQLQELDFI
jgi:hypothetical protein